MRILVAALLVSLSLAGCSSGGSSVCIDGQLSSGTNGPYDVSFDQERTFAITFDCSTRVTFQTSGPPENDTELALSGVGVQEEDDDGGNGLYSKLVVDVTPGSYVLTLRGYDGEAVEDVTIRVSKGGSAPGPESDEDGFPLD